jgi:hypothetical protein
VGRITDLQRRDWSQGTAGDWAQEAFALARDHAYGMLPEPSVGGVFLLSSTYIETATQDAAMQLSKAGVRLAFVLNRALASPQWPECSARPDRSGHAAERRPAM